MSHYWGLARNWADGLSLRERVLMFVAVTFVLVMLADFALLEPLYTQKQGVTAQLVQRQEKYKELQARVEALQQSRRSDAQSSLRARYSELKQELQQQDAYLQNRRSYLVEPDKMGGLLQRVLHGNHRLQLLSLQTLPVGQPLEKAAESGNEQRGIYKHGVRISVRGGYAELLRYVTELEKLPVQLLWGEISLQVERYPDAVLVLTLYTMSRDRSWLRV